MAGVPQTLESQDHGEKESELDKLEAEVNEMAQKILEYRALLPEQLKNTLASALASQRPLPASRFEDGSRPGPSGDPNPDVGLPVATGKVALIEEEEPEIVEKTQLLKQKISNNVSAMPIVLRRMKECISRIDNLDSCNGTIHPAFKRKRAS